MSSVKDAFDKLACHIAEKAVSKDTPLQESTDALKACTAYYAMLKKNEVPPSEPEVPEDDGPSFGALKESIEGEGNGAAGVRNRSRRN